MSEAECDLESLYKYKIGKSKRFNKIDGRHKYVRQEREKKLYDLTIAVWMTENVYAVVYINS